METLNIGKMFSCSWERVILASTVDENSLCKERTRHFCVKDVNLKESFEHACRLVLYLIVTQLNFHMSKINKF